MAYPEHAARIREEIGDWNRWREENPWITPDLSLENLEGLALEEINLERANLFRTNLGHTRFCRANLRGAIMAESLLQSADLGEADLRGANVRQSRTEGANLRKANLEGTSFFGCLGYETWFAEASLRGANLEKSFFGGSSFLQADLEGANLYKADLQRANFAQARLPRATLAWSRLNQANLSRADLSHANLEMAEMVQVNLILTDLSHARLTGVNLQGAQLVETRLLGANLSHCRVHGISAWDLKTDRDTMQDDLIITPASVSSVAVDNLEVAQFVYLLLRNENIRNLLDTVARRAVLLLGRFAQERKPVLEALREKLRALGFVPIVFDFQQPTERDLTETIATLSGLCLFVIADLTMPRSSPLELQATVPNYMIPFVPIVQKGEEPFAIYRDLQNKYDWVLDVLEYDSIGNLVDGLENAILKPALALHNSLLQRKTAAIRKRHLADYL